MRVVVLVKSSPEWESGQQQPSTEMLAEMGKFNDELVEAGIMLAGEGLQPSAKGKRVRFTGRKDKKVIDGPFAEAKELVAGFWIWKVKDMAEAVEWLKKAPFEDTEVEIRPVQEAEDFGDEYTPELREQERRQREKIEKQHG